MAEGKGSEQLADLLKQIQDEGYEVKSGGKNSSALTRDALTREGIGPEFEAWISWSKAI